MNLATVSEKLRSKGIVRDEPGSFYPRWLRGRPWAAGPDGVMTSTWFMETPYGDRLAQAEAWLVEPTPARAAYREIRKPGGGVRGIATFDRAYQAATYAVLEVVGPVIESRYSDAVVGFRVGYRLDETLVELMTLTRTAMPVMYVCDVYHCFDELDLGHLDRQIDTLVELSPDLRKWLKAHARTELIAPDGKIVSPVTRTKGVVQGSVLAPLLCNLYLAPFDSKVKKRIGPASVVRYADNIGCPGPDLATCKRAERVVEEELARIRLKVKPRSTRICNADNARNPCSFLGIAWTKDASWADPGTISKKVEMLKLDIELGRRDSASVEVYLDGLKKYFESILSGDAAEEATQQIEEALAAALLQQKGEWNRNREKQYPSPMRETTRAHQGRDGRSPRMITRAPHPTSHPSTGETNGTRIQTRSNLALGRIDHGRESYRGSPPQAPSGWMETSSSSTSPSTPRSFTLVGADEQQLHPGASPPSQRAVGSDQAPRVRHATLRVDRARAVAVVRLDGTLVELPIPGRLHSPTETELAGLVLGLDVAVEHGTIAVTLVVQDFYVRYYLDGKFKVGRPWNAYHLDALLARLEDPNGPLWIIEVRGPIGRSLAA